MTLEDIGDDALLCITDLTACCGHAQSPGQGILGGWHYPNETTVANTGDMSLQKQRSECGTSQQKERSSDRNPVIYLMQSEFTNMCMLDCTHDTGE